MGGWLRSLEDHGRQRGLRLQGRRYMCRGWVRVVENGGYFDGRAETTRGGMTSCGRCLVVGTT